MSAGTHPFGHAALHIMREQGGHLHATAHECIQSMSSHKYSLPHITFDSVTGLDIPGCHVPAAPAQGSIVRHGIKGEVQHLCLWLTLYRKHVP